MKAYHETNREEQQKIEIQIGQNGAFPTHFHINLEVYLLLRGEREIFFNGKSYVIQSGSVAFFDSYDFHGYGERRNDVEDAVIIIPFEFAERFNSVRKKLRAERFIVSNAQLTNRLYEITTRLLKDNPDENVILAGIELFLALLLADYQFTSIDYGKDNELIRKILNYVGNNYCSDISLSTIAKEFGYSAEHLSRVFHKYLKTGIPQYVNDLRLKHVEQLIKTHPEKKMTEIIFDSGFNSIQSYYRNKKRQ